MARLLGIASKLALALLLTLGARAWAAPVPSPTPSPSPQAEEPWSSGGTRSFPNTAERAVNPISLMGRLKVEEEYFPSSLGAKGVGNTIKLRGLLPFPREKGRDTGALVRVTVPITTPAGGTTALGDVELLSAFGTDGKFGLIGFGTIAVLPTAGTRAAGKGKWQLGPAVGIFYRQVPHLEVGFLAQNPISFAGDPSRKPVNELKFQPHLVVHFDKGWYAISNAEMKFDWLDNGREIPVNIGVGRVFKIGDQPVNLNFQYQWTVYRRHMTTPNNTLRMTLDFLFP